MSEGKEMKSYRGIVDCSKLTLSPFFGDLNNSLGLFLGGVRRPDVFLKRFAQGWLYSVIEHNSAF